MDVDPRHYENMAINDNDVQQLVLSYLVHNCYRETAESFVASTGMKQHTDHLEGMERRKRIYCSVLEGHASKAVKLTEELAPDLLRLNGDLFIDLLSLHFVELVRSRKCKEALEFAQNILTRVGELQEFVVKIEDCMALLAYEEPEKFPMFHLLSMEHRQQVADNLNGAILAHSNMPKHTAMERLIQQTVAVRECLDQEFVKDGTLSFSLDSFLKS